MDLIGCSGSYHLGNRLIKTYDFRPNNDKYWVRTNLFPWLSKELPFGLTASLIGYCKLPHETGLSEIMIFAQTLRSIDKSKPFSFATRRDNHFILPLVPRLYGPLILFRKLHPWATVLSKVMIFDNGEPKPFSLAIGRNCPPDHQCLYRVYGPHRLFSKLPPGKPAYRKLWFSPNTDRYWRANLLP